MHNFKEDSRLFRALGDENNLSLLAKLFEGEKEILTLENNCGDIEELSALQLVRKREENGRCYIRINKVGKFRAIAILESYLKTRDDIAACGHEEF